MEFFDPCQPAVEFEQIVWDHQIEKDLSDLVRLAIWEDLGPSEDVTAKALVAENAVGSAVMIAKANGVLAGLPAIPEILSQVDSRLRWQPIRRDGQTVAAGDVVGYIRGPARGILSAERVVLNIVGRLSGIATLTRRYVEAVAGTRSRIFDTRKTTPGFRRLEKYAVRCGGGWNHRLGLFGGILIKDNHLAILGGLYPQATHGQLAAKAVTLARDYLCQHAAFGEDASPKGKTRLLIEVEVESLEDLESVLAAGPDIILLDNMTPDELAHAAQLRNRLNPAVQLEASGGITLEIVREVALAGVERISVGALTHSATALDLSLEWVKLSE